MQRKLRKCACCGTEYKFCNKCPEDKDKPSFYFVFCSPNCKDIYEITSKFENGQIEKENARQAIGKCDLTHLENFGFSYKNSIKKIMSEPVTVKKQTGNKYARNKKEPIVTECPKDIKTIEPDAIDDL